MLLHLLQRCKCAYHNISVVLVYFVIVLQHGKWSICFLFIFSTYLSFFFQIYPNLITVSVGLDSGPIFIVYLLAPGRCHWGLQFSKKTLLSCLRYELYYMYVLYFLFVICIFISENKFHVLTPYRCRQVSGNIGKKKLNGGNTSVVVLHNGIN